MKEAEDLSRMAWSPEMEKRMGGIYFWSEYRSGVKAERL